MMDVYSFLTNRFHDCTKDQVVVHAICNLTGEQFEPTFKGVTAFSVSRKVCGIFAKHGIMKRSTRDAGTCSLMTQELVVFLIEKGCFSLPQIQGECSRLWTGLYQARYPANMP